MDRNELKVAALREEATNLLERVAELRATMHLLNEQNQQLTTEVEELRQYKSDMENGKENPVYESMENQQPASSQNE